MYTIIIFNVMQIITTHCEVYLNGCLQKILCTLLTSFAFTYCLFKCFQHVFEYNTNYLSIFTYVCKAMINKS